MRALVFLMMIMSAATIALAAEPREAPLTKATTDRQSASEAFVRKAGQDGLLEVEAGKLAISKTTNADVKAFAQQMVIDHGNANVELQKIAGTRYQVPQQLDAEHQAKLETLMSKSAEEFDRAYSADMMKGHQEALQLFTSTINDKEVSQELQQFARQTLPTLQEHHMMSMKLPGATAK